LHHTENDEPVTTAFDDDWPFASTPRPAAPPTKPTTEDLEDLEDLEDTAHPEDAAVQPDWPTAARDEQMAEMALAGETLQDIGTVFEVTRERVRQVLAKRYGITGEDMLALRRALKAERLASDGEKVLAWARTNPGRTLDDAAVATGVAVERIKRALTTEEVRRTFAPKRPKHQPRFSDEDILAAIVAAADEHGDPLSHSRYDEYAAVHGTPTASRVIQRFGTWTAACTAAGVGVLTRNRTYTRRWTPGAMVDAVIDYLASPGATGTFADYDRWARTQPQHPSSGTVRNQFGSWTAVKTAAMTGVRRPA
jgi:hypothetical protein